MNQMLRSDATPCLNEASTHCAYSDLVAYFTGVAKRLRFGFREGYKRQPSGAGARTYRRFNASVKSDVPRARRYSTKLSKASSQSTQLT